MIEANIAEQLMVILHVIWAYCQVYTYAAEVFLEDWAIKL